MCSAAHTTDGSIDNSIHKIMQVDILMLHRVSAQIFISGEIDFFVDAFIRLAEIDVEMSLHNLGM